MALYGIQIIGSDGFVNSRLPNASVVEMITDVPASNGSKSYPLSPGETLHFAEVIENPCPWEITAGSKMYTSISMSGNTLRWTVASEGWGWISRVIVYKTKVAV